jgi:hypothetical protein
MSLHNQPYRHLATGIIAATLANILTLAPVSTETTTVCIILSIQSVTACYNTTHLIGGARQRHQWLFCEHVTLI